MEQIENTLLKRNGTGTHLAESQVIHKPLHRAAHRKDQDNGRFRTAASLCDPDHGDDLVRELADCPATRELRYAIRAPRHVSRVNVIALPVTPRGPAPLHGPRAAA